MKQTVPIQGEVESNGWLLRLARVGCAEGVNAVRRQVEERMWMWIVPDGADEMQSVLDN